MKKLFAPILSRLAWHPVVPQGVYPLGELLLLTFMPKKRVYVNIDDLYPLAERENI